MRVVGLGHVGLALALVLVRAGFAVCGVERSATRRAQLRAGEPGIVGEPGMAELLAVALADDRLTIIAPSAPMADDPRSDIALICVATPVASGGLPDLRAVHEAARESVNHLVPDGLLVIESTVPCGTMRALYTDIAEGARIRLAHVPERVMPGKMLGNLAHMPRTLGTTDTRTAHELHAFYSIFVKAPLRQGSWEVAELTKTGENALRDVNIAFANTLARICEGHNVAFDDVAHGIRDVGGRTLLQPGLVGGTCLSKDTQLLRAASMHEAGLLEAARATNDGTFDYVASEVTRLLMDAKVSPETATVAVLGFSYAPGIGIRDGSPSVTLMQLLQMRGIAVRCHDPYLKTEPGESPNMVDVDSALAGADLALIVTPHPAYCEARASTWSTLLRTKLVYCISSLGPDWANGSDLEVHVLGQGRSRTLPRSAMKALDS